MQQRLYFCLSLFLSSACAMADMLHPLCLEPFVEPQDDDAVLTSLDLRACQKKYARLLLEQDTPWKASFSGTDQDASLATDEVPVYARYKVIGQMADHSVLIDYAINYGGSGTFSFGFLIKGLDIDHWADIDHALAKGQSSANLELIKTYEGGDRCYGGITHMNITSPTTVHVTRNLTPQELITLGVKKKDRKLSGYGNLPDCALCCAARYTESISLNDQKDIVSVEINGEHLGMGENQSKHQQCLYRLSGAGTHWQVLSGKELKNLQDTYQKSCLP